MRPDTLQEKHTRYHERRYTFAALVIWADLLVIPFAVEAYGSPEAALVFLCPALPVACVAIADWIASGVKPERCTCKFSQKNL